MKDTKSVGALAVLLFASECVRRGAIVSEPIGDNSRYDLIVDVKGRLSRVQIKSASTHSRIKGAYAVNTTRKVPVTAGGGKPKSVPYTKEELDVIATSAGDHWYFFTEFTKLPGIVVIYPDRSATDHKWNVGRDRWSLIGLQA